MWAVSIEQAHGRAQGAVHGAQMGGGMADAGTFEDCKWL